MRIIREDLATGETTTAATYDDITTQTAAQFMYQIAQKEADNRTDIDRLAEHNNVFGSRIVTRLVTLIGTNHQSLVTYRLECPIPADYVVKFANGGWHSNCDYYAYDKTVTNVRYPGNPGEPATDQYVTLPDGTQLRAKDGVTFDIDTET